MTQIPWLEKSQDFPPTDQALDDPNGLLAAGADLSPQRLISAYSQGIFPWFEEDQPIMWWSPAPRMVIRPEHLHVSRSLHKVLRKQEFEITLDQAFADVIKACAGTREYAEGTWITLAMQEAYIALHDLGYAHSVECWRDGELVGGLYGIALGQVFFGESMFSLCSNASKVAFVHLVKQLQAWGFQLIDCQQHTGHLQSLGAEEISRYEFERLLKDHIDVNTDIVANTDATGQGNQWQLSWKYASENF